MIEEPPVQPERSSPLRTPANTLSFGREVVDPPSVMVWIGCASTHLHHLEHEHGWVVGPCRRRLCDNGEAGLAFLDELGRLPLIAARVQHRSVHSRRARVAKELGVTADRRSFLGLLATSSDRAWVRWRAKADAELADPTRSLDERSVRMWEHVYDWFGTWQLAKARPRGSAASPADDRSAASTGDDRSAPAPTGEVLVDPAWLRAAGENEPIEAFGLPGSQAIDELEFVDEARALLVRLAREAMAYVAADRTHPLLGAPLRLYDESRTCLPAEFKPPSDYQRARVTGALRDLALGMAGNDLSMFGNRRVDRVDDAAAVPIADAIRVAVRRTLQRIDPPERSPDGRTNYDQQVKRTALSVMFVFEQLFGAHARAADDEPTRTLAERGRRTMTELLARTRREEGRHDER